jgi:hypothetical protein
MILVSRVGLLMAIFQGGLPQSAGHLYFDSGGVPSSQVRATFARLSLGLAQARRYEQKKVRAIECEGACNRWLI